MTKDLEMDFGSTPKHAQRTNAFVIIGSHRSGTSAMTRVLSLVGARLPADLLAPHPVDNERGFWESRLVVEFNDEMLASRGHAWNRPPPWPQCPPTDDETERAARILQHQYGDERLIALKDPRISLNVPLWSRALRRDGREPCYILMVRHPEEVAASLHRRGDMSEEQGLALWASYMMLAERNTRRMKRLFVTFDDLLANWRSVLARVAEVADDLPLPSEAAAETIDDFLVDRLRRERKTGLCIRKGVDFGEIHATLAALRPDDDRALDKLDGFWERLREARFDARQSLQPLASPADVIPRDFTMEAKSAPGSNLRWLLVAGAPRSGVSLLRAMLNAHPQIALLDRYGLTKLFRRIDDLADNPPERRPDWDAPVDPGDVAFADLAAFYRGRPGRRQGVASAAERPAQAFDALALGVFAGMVSRDDAAAGGEPSVVGDATLLTKDLDVATLFRRMPSLRLILIIRNPADSVRSSLIRREATRRGRDVWPIGSVQQAVGEWIRGWREACDLAERHPDAAIVVKYEDLCSAPNDLLTKVYASFGIEPHDSTIPITVCPAHLRAHTDAEQKVLETLLHAVIEAWPNRNPVELMRDFAALRPPYVFGEAIDLRSEAASPLLRGFSFREDWGRWTDGSAASITIEHGEHEGLFLVEIVVARVFGGTENRCDAVFRVNGGMPTLATFADGGGRVSLVAQAQDAATAGVLVIDILIARPKTPDEPPSDSRRIGLGIASCRVIRLVDGL